MDFISSNTSIVAVVVVIVIIVALLGFIASRIRRVPPNQALIVVGRGAAKDAASGITSPQKVIIGGRTFIWPIFQEGFKLSLEQYQTSVDVTAIDSNFIRTSVKATVNFKVTGSEDGVRRAAQRYLLQQAKLPEIVQQSLEGSLRGLIGGRAVDELVKSFAQLAQDAVTETKGELAELGLQIETLNIREIETPGSTYLADRGRAEAAQARQIAEVREAETVRAAALSRIENEQLTAERQRELDIRVASIKADTERANAEANAAGELARAEQATFVAGKEREAVVEQAKVAEQRLNIEVRQPAEAAAYAAVQKAQADRDTEKASVDVEVYRRQQTAEAARTAAVNEAESITALGNANAAATRAKGEAEAAAVKALAEAQNLLSREALASRAIDAMPEVARRMAEPLSNVDNISIISTEGASALTKSVAQNMTELPEVIKQATGLDLSALLAGIGGGLAAKSTGSGTGAGASVAGTGRTATATSPATDAESPVI
ncbi:SPFH domain-containing protein [Agreia sp. Leaf210]|uniref:SPFH domain-containing protein n=1 Tax=Agreia sp. Leaf210 TaxID=1735682 RepID=UPI0006F9EFBE|nr:flotillin family protein [Agreia sp. Leaf210]KQM59475.1 hypothetical protein ASE64_08980 [Agreia sp. Leaf210]